MSFSKATAVLVACVSSLEATPLADVCVGGICKDVQDEMDSNTQQSLGLLQRGANDGSRAVDKSEDKFFGDFDLDSLSKLSTNTKKYCLQGTSLCAEQESRLDFTKLGAACVALTGGEYNPMTDTLQEGSCSDQGYECEQSDKALTSMFENPLNADDLPGPLKDAYSSGSDEMAPYISKFQSAMKVVGDDVTIYAKKTGWSCPSPNLLQKAARTGKAAEEFMPSAKTKHCVQGENLCAEQTSRVDFTKLGGACIALTGGSYNPITEDLKDGSCSDNGFAKKQSKDALSQAFSSPLNADSLPGPLKSAYSSGADAMSSFTDAFTSAMNKVGDDVTVYAAK